MSEVPSDPVPSTRGHLAYSTPNAFEQKFGYYRAVRRGPFIFVSGTTALKLEGDTEEDVLGPDAQVEEERKESQVHFPASAYKQACLAMKRCIEAVVRLGGKGAEDVVRVKMFVANHDDCLAVGAAYKEYFAAPVGSQTPSPKANLDGSKDEHGKVVEVDIGAAATMIVVQNGFVDHDMLVEVEVDAVVL